MKKNVFIPTSDMELSNFIKIHLNKEMDDYFKEFKDNHSCKSKLSKWKGWHYSLRLDKLEFVCKNLNSSNVECVGKSAYRCEKINHDNNRRIIFRCVKCKHEVTETSDTVFSGSRKRIWIWFITLYLMLVLDGKKPKSYILEKYFDNKMYEDDGILDDDEKNRHVIKKQINDIMNKYTRLIFESKSRSELVINYSKLFGLHQIVRCNNFNEWYKYDESKRIKWKLLYIDKCDNETNKFKNNILKLNKIDINNCYYSICFNTEDIISKGEWILVSEIFEKIIKTRWVYVECIVKSNNFIDSNFDNEGSSESYSKNLTIIIYNKKRPVYLKRPFRISRIFIKSFQDWSVAYFDIKNSDNKKNSIINYDDSMLENLSLSIKGVGHI